MILIIFDNEGDFSEHILKRSLLTGPNCYSLYRYHILKWHPAIIVFINMSYIW